MLVKGSNYLELLSRTRTVVFDKTGTLTRGVFEVSGIHHSQLKDGELLEYAALAESASSQPPSAGASSGPAGRSWTAAGSRIFARSAERASPPRWTAMLWPPATTSSWTGWASPMSPAAAWGTIIHMAIDGQYMGHILISDVVKPTSKQAIRALKAAGVRRTVMLTGDAGAVADHVAAELGVDQVYSQLLPADKVEKVEELLAGQGEREKLAFVGDGINDAPVLSRADIGIAMGALGSDAAIEAADVVLMDDDPMKIAKAIKISRKCLGIVYQNIVFAIGIKLACLLLVALGLASMWLAVFADVGVMILAVLNAIRALFVKDL